MTERQAKLSVIASTVLFGTTGAAQALGPEAASPSQLAAVRVGIGGLLLLAIVAGRGTLVGARRWPWGLVATASLATAAFQVTFFAAIDAAGVVIGSTVAIVATPVLTGVFAAVLSRRLPGRAWTLATALGAAGAVALSLDGGAGSGAGAGGVALAALSAACFAVSTLAGKQLIDRGHGPAAVMAVTFSVAGVLLMPSLATGDVAWLGTAPGFATAAYLTLFPTVLGYVLFARGLVRLPGPDAVTLTLGELLVAATLGVVLLGERPGVLAAAGAVLLVAGMVIAVRTAHAVEPAPVLDTPPSPGSSRT